MPKKTSYLPKFFFVESDEATCGSNVAKINKVREDMKNALLAENIDEIKRTLVEAEVLNEEAKGSLEKEIEYCQKKLELFSTQPKKEEPAAAETS